MKKKKKTVLEAVDTLSHLADLDVEKKEAPQWNEETVRDTFQTINTYLQHTYQKDRADLAEPEIQKGIRSMIQLAGEAADKVDRYTGLFKGTHAKNEAISEFKKLEQFYFSKVLSKLKKDTGEESWELLGGNENRQILKDLESVRQDQNYELFYMTYGDGAPFFSSNLLKHLRMVGNFDETFISSKQQESVLSKLEIALDKELHHSAQSLLDDNADLIDLFYKEALHHKGREVPRHLSSALMALFLTANPKNLRHNLAKSIEKCAIDYWTDFIFYLRLAIRTKKNEKWHVCLKLMTQMSRALFLSEGTKQADLELIYLLTGVLKRPFFPSIAEASQAIEQILQNYPSGPLMKVLKLFRQGKNGKGFDPLLQNYGAHQLFTLVTEEVHTTVIHTPAPIGQMTPERGEIVPEFISYLHSLEDRKHLYVNLQDQTSWKEKLRCRLLEEISQKEEFSPSFKLMTLSKQSDFYHQIGNYAALEEAAFFCKTCEEQLTGGRECGFYFSPGSNIKTWVRPLIDFVHTQFFKQQKKLSQPQRLDFIEILYFFITLRYLDQEKPDNLNFSCKDGIDIGSATAASFYGFARMLSSSDPWTKSDRDCLFFSLFVPPLFVRHRSIDSSRLHRALSALEHFEKVLKVDRESVLKACAKALPDASFKSFKISEVA